MPLAISLHKSLQEIDTASYNMLDHLYKRENSKNLTEKLTDKIKTVVNAPGNSLTAEIDIGQAKIIKNIIQKEKVHHDKHVLYHGLDSDIWFAYRVLSQLCYMLDQICPQTTILRSLEAFFEQFPTAIDLLNFVSQEKDNYSRGFQAVGVSTNPTLFSNLKKSSSCTLDYFFFRDSLKPPEDVWNIIVLAFEELGFPSNVLVPKFREIFNQNNFGKARCLLQFFVHPTIVPQVCYASSGRGHTLEKAEGKETFRDSLEVLNLIQRGQKVNATEDEESIQVRLHSNLAKWDPGNIIAYDYFSDGAQERLEKIDQSIREVFADYLQ